MAHARTTLLIKRLFAQILKMRTHQIFTLSCCEAIPLKLLDDEKITLLSKDTLAQFDVLCDQMLALNRDNDAYLQDIKRGRVEGIVISVDEKIVHYGFLLKQNRTRCLLGLPAGAALIGNSYTIPAYRGRGCQGRSVLARANLAREAGFISVFAETSHANQASQRGMMNAGMQMVGRMDFVIIFRFLVIRWRRPPGFAFFSWCS